MSRRLVRLGLAGALLFTFGCSSEESTPPSPVTPVITAVPATVTADGTSSLTVTVTGTPPITVAASRGTFQPGGTGSAQIATSGGALVLRPCDARLNPSCAGPTVVTAAGSDGGFAQAVVQFQGFEDCDNRVDDNSDGLVDCADPQCPLDTPCAPHGLVCSATAQCNKCTGNGGYPEASGETSCGDGFDNDCDGLADCADPGCEDLACTTQNGTPGLCDAGACVCAVSEQPEASCADQRDNDCDGLVDCLDPSCLGKIADANGMVCAGPAGSGNKACPTGTQESQCADGKDDDCDGATDCYDTECQPVGAAPPPAVGQPCNAFGGRCTLPNGVPTCGCPSGNTSEVACAGGVDDDCDGKTDCADEDCRPAGSGLAGAACGPYGQTCTSAGACACASAVEICNNYDATLGNPIDDDCDGRANCADEDCKPSTPGAWGDDCSRLGEYGMACDSTGTCACTGNGGTPEAAETTCDDGIDNDCDFLVDCADDDCRGTSPRPCGPAGATCSTGASTACLCPGGTTESACDDGVDNDCNGKTDCEEPTCAARACSATSPSYVCISGVCSDPAVEYGVAVTPAATRIPAVAGAQTAVDVLVTHKGVPKSGVAVNLSLSDPALGGLSAYALTTDAQGRARVTYTAAGGIGVETVTVTVAGIGAMGSATVETPGIGQIRLRESGGVLHRVMGVRSSGFQEQNQLTVEVLDTSGRPYPDGLTVTFEHRKLGGSSLSDPVAPTAQCPAPSCVRSNATAQAGVATVRLFSGTVAGVVRVSASATAGGLTRLFELPTIPIVGAKPNAGHLSIVCDPVNVPAYAETTCHVSAVDAPFTCVALLKDRYNNLLGRATDVSFMSEAGSVGPPAITPEYDPDAGPTEQPELGTALGLVSTLGGKLPKDVTPNPGEVSVTTAPDVCGVSTRNPRDGVATVVAWTPGEEAFFDANGNGEYDFGEPFIDLPEPFVDYDDDDVRDPDEPFVDADGDGAFTPPNGAWDSNAAIWTKTVIVYTGMPASMRAPLASDPFADYEHLSRWMEPADVGTYANPTPVASFAVRPAFPPDPFQDCNENGFRDAGAVLEPYDDTNSNGAYDPGEDFTDCNGDGVRGQADEPYLDLSGNGAYDATGVPATSETLWVAATDRNLNRLAAQATYSVTKPETAQFSFSYHGKPALPDRRGLGFGYQPCLAVAPFTCGLDCADVTVPPDVRCVMRTRVADFDHGYVAGVTITGGAEGTSDGATQLFWNVELFGETLVVPVSGTHQ